VWNILAQQVQQGQNIPQGQIGGWNAWVHNMEPEANQDDQNIAPVAGSDEDQPSGIQAQQ
jgi:hypothetical protein